MPDQPALSSTATGFGRLAGRLSAWTTRGVMTAMIVVAGLGFGRQVLRWWEGDAPAGSTPADAGVADGLGDPGRAHLLQLGEGSGTLRRQVVAGDMAEAARRLQALCCEATRAARAPSDAPGPSERRFLQSIADKKPAEEEAGVWQVYLMEEGFPLAAGLRTVEGAAPPAGAPKVASLARRVVIWGMALPSDAGQWTLYAFQVSPSSGGGSGLAAEIPLPESARNTVSMQVLGGGAAVGFVGEATTERDAAFTVADAWRRHFENWFAEHGWTAVGVWRTGPVWQCRWRDAHGTATADVQYRRERGQWTGLLLITPLATPPEERIRQ